MSGLGEGSGESGGDPGRTGYSVEYQGRKGNNSKDGRYESRDKDNKGSKNASKPLRDIGEGPGKDFF